MAVSKVKKEGISVGLYPFCGVQTGPKDSL